MSLINVSKLTFSYDGSYDDVFCDVSFQIDTDWKLGFCGRNGRGKTTFLKLLMGQYEYRGTITANVDFEYFPFSVEDRDLGTLDIIMSIAPEAQIWQIQKELSKLAVEEEALYRPFSTLSNGEQTKTLLAGLFLRENSFLLIDEPTNHLDMAAREVVAKYLNGKKGFILVSHDRLFLDGCVDHILSINKADIEIQRGNFSSWFHEKQLRDSYEIAENQRIKKEIGHLTAAMKRTAKWSEKAESAKIGFVPGKTEKSIGRRPYEGEKSRKLMARSMAIRNRVQQQIEEKAKLLKNIESADILKINPLTYHARRLLSLEKVTVSYEGREVFRDLSCSLEQGERLALLGGNGTGKSSVIKLICGEDIPHSGQVNIGGRLIISYVPQDAAFLSGDLSGFTKDRQIDETLFRAILRKLDFSRTQFEKDMRDYSAGQKKKVLIAASLCQRAHVYIWDEPLNYIDVLSRIQIEELIAVYRPTMLFVEHDRAFCNSIATKTICLANRRE